MIKTPVRVVSTLTLLIAFFAVLTACGNTKTFDSAAWLKGDLRARGRMCEDLVARKVLIGQPVAEAKRLLGEPNKTYAAAGILSYNIDLGWPLKDPVRYGLQVHLDQNSNVRLVKIVD